MIEPSTEPTAAAAAAAPVAAAVVVGERARRIHADAPVIDGHNDLPWQLRRLFGGDLNRCDLSVEQADLHTDIPRLRRGGVGAQFWSVYVPSGTARSGDALRVTIEQIDLVKRMCARYADAFELARTADDVERIRAEGRVAGLIGMEGGHSIEDSLAVLRQLFELGARYLTLTHVDSTGWADSATDEARHGGAGLTPFGEEVVREMNRLGMLVDISHVSADTMQTVLRVSRAPVIASHSSAFALAPHPRNVPDEVLGGVASGGGVVMVNFFPGFVLAANAAATREILQITARLRQEHGDGEAFEQAMEEWESTLHIERGTVRDVVDHVEHIARVAGVEHVGLGSDFDGIPSTPGQLEDVACYPFVTQELLDRGWSEGDVRKVLGENVLRVMRRAERVAASLA